MKLDHIMKSADGGAGQARQCEPRAPAFLLSLWEAVDLEAVQQLLFALD